MIEHSPGVIPKAFAAAITGTPAKNFSKERLEGTDARLWNISIIFPISSDHFSLLHFKRLVSI
jgi:hypothetical protein